MYFVEMFMFRNIYLFTQFINEILSPDRKMRHPWKLYQIFWVKYRKQKNNLEELESQVYLS